MKVVIVHDILSGLRDFRRLIEFLCRRFNVFFSMSVQPGFDQLYQHIKNLSQDPEELSQMEKVTLMEALVLIR